MAAKQIVDGLNLSTKIAMPLQPCPGCMAGKMERSPFPIGKTRAIQIGQLIHFDLCGPMHIETPGGARFFVLFTDDFIGYRTVFFLKQKLDVSDCFKEFVNILYTKTGQLVHTLRADNGGEFTGQTFRAWMSEKGIRAETSAPHTPEQNGVSERANRTIVEGVRCLLHAKHLPLYLWGEAISCTVYTLNRVITKAAPNTPYQNWYGNKPDVSNLRIFGSTAYIHVPKAERKKLDSESQKCYFVGYSTTQKAYRFWEPVSRKMYL
jgi:transposase InsO family protein